MHSKAIKRHRPNPKVYRRAAEIIANGYRKHFSCWAIRDAFDEIYPGMDYCKRVDLIALYQSQYGAMFASKGRAAGFLNYIETDAYGVGSGKRYVESEKAVRHPYWNDETRPYKDQRVMALLMADIVESPNN